MERSGDSCTNVFIDNNEKLELAEGIIITSIRVFYK